LPCVLGTGQAVFLGTSFQRRGTHDWRGTTGFCKSLWALLMPGPSSCGPQGCDWFQGIIAAPGAVDLLFAHLT
jgi:hypothetical protein